MFETLGARVVLEGHTQYVASANRVNAATNSMVGTVRRAQTQTSGFSSGLRQIAGTNAALALGMGGLTLALFGVAGGLTASGRAAIDFESSFAGIRKTVDATEQEFDALAQANRDLAKDIPTSVNELNRIGELAGQLGVTGSANILKFERTIADLTNTTNLSAEEGATAFAQIANILELPIDNVDRLASSVVELGNKGESTETEITNFALRIAGAGKLAGLTADEITGVGAAFANVGVQAEAGGTAIQRILISMIQAVAQGGEELETFAETAGLSIDAFRELAKNDPAEAFIRFFEGLGESGTEAILILDELGLADARVIRSALGVAQAGDELRSSIDQSTRAFAENTALTIEAEKRYATTAARLGVLRNNFNDVAIDVGNKLLPALVDASNASVSLLNALRPLEGILPSIATAIGAAAVAFGAFLALRAAASIIATTAAFAQLAVQVRTTSQAFTLLQAAGGSVAGPLLAITVAITAADLAMRAFTGEGLVGFFTGAERAKRRAAELAAELGRLREIITASDDPNQGIATVVSVQVAKLEEAVNRLNRLEGLKAGPLQREGGFKAIVDAKRDVEAVRKELEKLFEELGPAERRELAIQLRVSGAGELDDDIAKIIREQELAATLAQPAFADLSKDMFEFGSANEEAAVSGKELGDVLADDTELAQTFADAIDAALAGIEDNLDPVTEGLKLQKAALEQQRRVVQAAGGDTAVLDARIESLNNRIEQSTAVLTQNQQVIRLAAAALQDAGVSAGRSQLILQDFAASLDALPDEQQVQIRALIDQGSLDQVFSVLTLLRQGVEVPVAFAIAGQFQSKVNIPPLLRNVQVQNELDFIGLGGDELFDLAQGAKAMNTEVAKAEDTFGNFTSTADGAASALDVVKDRLTLVMEAIGDGIISLSEAVALGIDEQSAALLELEITRQRAMDSAFRERVELIKTAEAFRGLTPEQVKFRLALKAIADNLRETNRTAAQFTLDSLTDALENFRSELDRVLNRPTKETLLLQLRLLELQRRRAQRRAGGASDEELEGIDEEIEQLQNLLELRRIELDIERTKIELGDATVLSDREQLDQARLLGIAIGTTSREVQKMGGVVFNETLAMILLTDRVLIAADAIGGMAIRAAQAGGMAQAQHGLVGDFGSGTPVMLHGVEAVVPLDRGFVSLPQFAGSAAGGSVFAPTLQQMGFDRQSARRQFKQWVDEWLIGAESRSNRAGAPLSQGIG